ncbi:MAG: hypothetical protein INR69_06805 [Mucilaginibacter polytrichastri]|nr:hypothetical protein [Mucilaginibacter polytrichastri]
MHPTKYPLMVWAGFLMVLFCLGACKKDEKNIPEIERLPPATQSGKYTAGCLVDGRALLPDKIASVGTTGLKSEVVKTKIGWYFNLSIVDSQNKPNTRALSIVAKDIDLKEGRAYPLGIMANTGADGVYLWSTGQNDYIYSTAINATGLLTITKLDPEKGVVAGTFYLDAVRDDGKRVEIREGRFDVWF